jgi:hypothetical protein
MHHPIAAAAAAAGEDPNPPAEGVTRLADLALVVGMTHLLTSGPAAGLFPQGLLSMLSRMDRWHLLLFNHHFLRTGEVTA